MRAAVRGLTLRGRCLLAAGAAAGVCAVALGQRDLLRVAVLLVALPLLAVALVARTRYRLASTRRLDAHRVSSGQPVTVTVSIGNESRLPTGLLLAEETLPYTLGGRPRFVVDRLEGGGRRGVRYTVRTDLRGRYRIGPLTVRLTDPFGLCRLTRSFTDDAGLVVTPQVWQLPPVRLRGEWAGSGESRARSVATAGEDDVATREYRQGDELRRVHWRSTARRGELMVRREEQPWQSRAALLLDSRAAAHRGDGPGSSFEWAVSAVASVAVHLAAAGYLLRLVTPDGSDVSAAGESADTFVGATLEHLADVRTGPQRGLDAGVEVLRHGSGTGLVVAVLGALGPGDVDALVRLRHGTGHGVAVLLDPGSWAPAAPAARLPAAQALAEQARVLRTGGWRVLVVRCGEALADRWRDVAEPIARDPGPAAAAAAR